MLTAKHSFCMYRLRTADKGRPLIISDQILREYADNDVDTLHKKNLLSLGEDRYLTTLMTKHFPTMSYKFIPDAYASTAAPETWSVLLSQRRRWINSTVHNLVELAYLKDLCGFCCFSMRFVVLIDLLGTIILPATCVYLGYLIYRVASHQGQFPLISIVILAGVYGLQAIVFIVKRQWQHIGWMIIYICAYPIYSFVLPLYSFWKQDDFTWGNTRVVLGEKGDKRVVAINDNDEGFDPRSIPLQRWDDYALANNLPGHRGGSGDYYFDSSLEKQPHHQLQQMQQMQHYGTAPPTVYADDAAAMEMDELHSTYSSVRPASTVLAGFAPPPSQHPNARASYLAPSPQSPGIGVGGNRQSQSRLSSFSRYTDLPQQQQPMSRSTSRHMSIGNLSAYQDNNNNSSAMRNSRYSLGLVQSSDNLLQQTTSSSRRASRSPLGGGYGVGGRDSRPVSAMFDMGGAAAGGPDEMAITDAIRACLADVDLDSVTKKQG